MKMYVWDSLKNAVVQETRGRSFEDVVAGIDGGKLIDVLAHPDQHSYPNQKLYIIEIDEYAWVVPCVEKEHEVCLKTVFPSRKYTKQYLKK